MAEGETPQWSSKISCRYFLHGMCRKGNRCPYSHSHDVDPIPSRTCKFYLRGSCSFGDQCRYDHIKPRDKNQPAGSRNSSDQSASSSIPHRQALNTSSKPKVNYLLKNSMPDRPRKMETLKKSVNHSISEGSSSATQNHVYSLLPAVKKPLAEWVKAAEFIPGKTWQSASPSSYSAATASGLPAPAVQGDPPCAQPDQTDADIKTDEMCPFATQGKCRFGENCAYMHGQVCELCGCAVLHPTDHVLREQHKEHCLKQLEADMELSFAVARSKDKVCGICMEIVWDKNPANERRFGILSQCSHIFCLSCIRKWRACKQFDNTNVRACPECRTKSDFITPSKYWMDDIEEKKKLIEGYKTALSKKTCKYFDQGRGECPFNENCFYMHAYPDGRKASPKPVRRRRRENAEGEVDLLQQIILWEFLEDSSVRRIQLAQDLREQQLDSLLPLLYLWDSSSDSDYSDPDMYP